MCPWQPLDAIYMVIGCWGHIRKKKKTKNTLGFAKKHSVPNSVHLFFVKAAN